MKKKLYCFWLLFSILITQQMVGDCNSSCSNVCVDTKTIFVPRSQSRNAARDLTGVQPFINLYDMDCVYGAFSTTLEYTRSFRPDLITEYFFGPAACNGCVTFSGSRVADRGVFDILADYFGLPQDFKSTVCFTPRIQNVLLDFYLYVGLDQWIDGGFLKVHAPLVNTRWDMHGRECIINEGSLPYEQGYMSTETINRDAMGRCVLQAFNGCVAVGDMLPLAYGKIHPGGLTKTRLSDIEVALGWNFFNDENVHLGVALLAALPSGNKPTARYLFEPIVGNFGHFELGVGFTSHLKLWETKDQTQAINFYCDINLTHLFSTKQVRSYDFINTAQNSRYISMATYQRIPKISPGNIGNNLINEIGHLSNAGLSYEYASQIQPSINLTSLCSDVKIALEGDAVFKLAYTRCNFEFDLGYNFWGRTKETVTIADEILINTYGLKGDSYMWGAVNPAAPLLDNAAAAQTAYANNVPNSRLRLSATQDQLASVYSGANWAPGNTIGGLRDPRLNPGVDNIEEAETRNPITSVAQGEVFSPIPGVGVGTGLAGTNVPIDVSNPPIFETITDLDPLSPATPSVFTHKLFAATSYYWCSEGRVQPFLSGAVEVEFDTKRKYMGKNCACRSALNQWGIWLKGGIGF